MPTLFTTENAEWLKGNMAHPMRVRIPVGEPIQLAKVKASEHEDEDEIRNVNMLAYTGREVDFGFFGGRMIFDLAGAEIPKQVVPFLRQHDANRPVGQSTSVSKNSRNLRMLGTISKVTPAGSEVIGLADTGFEWQVSMGADIKRVENIPSGDKVIVNGRKFLGPGTVARTWAVLEGSFVPLGLDDGTSAAILSNEGKWVDVDSYEEPEPAKNDKESDMPKIAELEKKNAELQAENAKFKAAGEAAGKAELEKYMMELREAIAEKGDITDGTYKVALAKVEEIWPSDRGTAEVIGSLITGLSAKQDKGTKIEPPAKAKEKEAAIAATAAEKAILESEGWYVILNEEKTRVVEMRKGDSVHTF